MFRTKKNEWNFLQTLGGVLVSTHDMCVDEEHTGQRVWKWWVALVRKEVKGGRGGEGEEEGRGRRQIGGSQDHALASKGLRYRSQLSHYVY